MLKQNYVQRVKQRTFYLKTGATMVLVGFALFALIFFLRMLSFFWVASFLTSTGTIMVVLLSRIGWSRHLLVDLILNQISILLIILGIGAFCFKESLNHVGIYMALIGLLLAGLGMHFHSSITADDLIE
jgi:hypothetical protein